MILGSGHEVMLLLQSFLASDCPHAILRQHIGNVDSMQGRATSGPVGASAVFPAMAQIVLHRPKKAEVKRNRACCDGDQ
jgi:hypothetical protein